MRWWRKARKGGGVSVKSEMLKPEWIDDVANTQDTDLRAHRVALTYWTYARQLDRDINESESVWTCIDEQRQLAVSNANWFTFATWATVTVNRDLALRRTPAGVDRLLPGKLRKTLTPMMFNLKASDGQRVSRALSWGQRLVFVSTTLIYLSRLHSATFGELLSSASEDEVRNTTFDHVLRLGRWGDLNYLDRERHLTVVWQAFDHYRQAAEFSGRIRGLHEKDPRNDSLQRLYALRARSMLFANLMISAVEQDILHQAVGQTINQVPERFTSALTDGASRWGERLAGVPRQVTALEAPLQMVPLTKSATEAWARFMTSQILVVLLPSETLRLGKDVPPRSAIAPMFPPDLNDLSSLPKGPAQRSGSIDDVRLNEDVFNLVASFDRSLGDGRGSAARDWRRYDDRLNWIVNMMRSRQQDRSLWWSPYSVEDQNRIREGQLPKGWGDPSSHEVEAPVGGLPSVQTHVVQG
jgi:hypothetical protein